MIVQKMRRGFISGLALSLLVAVGIFSAVQFTSAQSDNSADSSGLLSRNSGTAVVAASTNNTGRTSTNSNSAATTATTAVSNSTNVYVALGDSVAAGLGLPPVTNANRLDRTCGRSVQSYAYEVGRQLDYDTRLLACSGATAGDLFTRQGIDGPNPAAQITAAFANGQPDVISITAGANDALWQRFIQKCYTGICGTPKDTTVANGALLVLQTKLNIALTAIKGRSQDSPPTVVLTGYYSPVSSNCSRLQNQISAAEITWLNASAAALNKTIQDMAISTYSSFARYAVVDFSGHDLCSPDPWIQGLTDAAPVHPTAEGQRAIARSVVQAIQQ